MKQGCWPGLKSELGVRGSVDICPELHPCTQLLLRTSSSPHPSLKRKNVSMLAGAKCENSRGPQSHPGISIWSREKPANYVTFPVSCIPRPYSIPSILILKHSTHLLPLNIMVLPVRQHPCPPPSRGKRTFMKDKTAVQCLPEDRGKCPGSCDSSQCHF